MNYRKPFEACSPEEVGIRSEDILSYIEALEASQTEMHGLMIMRHGKLSAQGWWAPFGPTVRHGLQSHTKTYAATAVGIAYTEGLLKLTDCLASTFGEHLERQGEVFHAFLFPDLCQYPGAEDKDGIFEDSCHDHHALLHGHAGDRVRLYGACAEHDGHAEREDDCEDLFHDSYSPLFV